MDKHGESVSGRLKRATQKDVAWDKLLMVLTADLERCNSEIDKSLDVSEYERNFWLLRLEEVVAHLKRLSWQFECVSS